MRNTTIALLLGVYCLCANVVHASSFVSSDPAISVFDDNNLNAQVLSINPPNAQGFSINRFSAFSVDSKPLLLANLNASQYPESITIVIIANQISIANAVEVLGPAADVLFLSESPSGTITCSNCTFKNFYRATLAVNNGALNFSGEMDINAAPNGTINLVSMNAPGLMVLDVVAGRVNTSGTLNFNQKVNKSTLGGYETADSGKYTMGTTSVNLTVGNSRWNYYSQLIEYLPVSSYQSQIGGTFRAVGFKLSTGAPLDLSASIDTRTDLLTTLRYRGAQVVSQEKILIDSFSSSNLKVKNDLNSGGDVTVKTTRSLVVDSNVNIVAANVQLIAKDSLTNYGKIDAQSAADLAAYRVFNEGAIKGQRQAGIYADHVIANQYGGVITAQNISLQTNPAFKGYVINGSRSPFRYFFSQLLPIGSNYFDTIDHRKIGTYYTAGVHEIPNLASQGMPAKTNANIYGRVIDIKTVAFENINQYYEIIEGDSLAVKRNLLNQVSVIAEDALNIQADEYILNSSAFLGSETPTSKVFLDANVISNERYRILSILDRITASDSITASDVVQIDRSSETIGVKLATFSPPGMLFSMGNFEAHADSLFLNSIGYFEVFGNALFNAVKMRDAGLATQLVQKNMSVTTYYYASYCGGPCVGSSVNEVVVDPKQIDSLFYVDGSAMASNVEETIIFDYSPFDGYLQQAIETYLSALDWVGTEQSENIDIYSSEESFVEFVSIRGGVSYDIQEQNGTFSISWWENVDWTQYTNTGNWLVAERKGGEKQYSIFDEMKALYYRLADMITDLLNEIKWWN